MAKIRVYQLADKWGFDKLWLVEELNKRGHSVKTHLASIEESTLDFKPEDLTPEGRKKIMASEGREPRAKETKKNSGKNIKKSESSTVRMLQETPSVDTAGTEKQRPPKSSGSSPVISGVSLAVAILAALLSLVAIFSAPSPESKSSAAASKALAREQILKDLSGKLKEQEELIRGLLKDTVVRSEESRSLSQLRSQAKIVKELAARTGVAGTERLEEIENAVEELALATEEGSVKE